MRAVVAGDFQRVQVMVGKLAEIDERNAGRETPLMVAAHYDEDSQNGSECMTLRFVLMSEP
jgi:hypothetical protein